jgi:nucleotide-binding universal stress UspA family protein
MGRTEIVVGLDESPAAAAALRWAAAEAIRTSSTLRAVHALSWPFGVRPPDHNAPAAVEPMSHIEVDHVYRASITTMFDAIDPRPDWIIQFARGDAGPVLVHQSAHAQALVIGTPYHVGLGRLVAGSVAHYCLSHALCPVIAVPAPASAVLPNSESPTVNEEANR